MGRTGMGASSSGLRWRRESGHRGLQCQHWVVVDTAFIRWRKHTGGLGRISPGYSAELMFGPPLSCVMSVNRRELGGRTRRQASSNVTIAPEVSAFNYT